MREYLNTAEIVSTPLVFQKCDYAGLMYIKFFNAAQYHIDPSRNDIFSSGNSHSASVLAHFLNSLTVFPNEYETCNVISIKHTHTHTSSICCCVCTMDRGVQHVPSQWTAKIGKHIKQSREREREKEQNRIKSAYHVHFHKRRSMQGHTRRRTL